MHMYDEILEQPDILKNSREYNSEILNDIVKRIKQKKPECIVIAARGTSDHAATYAKYCFEVMTGTPVSLAAPSVVTVYKGNLDYRDKMVIGITQSGMAEDVRILLREAKKQGALTVACTNTLASPVAEEAEFHLYCNAGAELAVAATKTFMAEMFLMALLVAMQAGNGKLIGELDRLPWGIGKFLKEADKIAAIMKDYVQMNSCFILGRGFVYPIALEAALKMQETAYTLGYAHAISDFWHGPLAMVTKGTPVFLYCSGGAMQSDEIKMLDRLNEIGADVLAITPDSEIAAKAGRSVILPNADPALLPFYHLAVAQLFAYGLTIAKGLNPDSPRNIKKVTITK